MANLTKIQLQEKYDALLETNSLLTMSLEQSEEAIEILESNVTELEGNLAQYTKLNNSLMKYKDAADVQLNTFKNTVSLLEKALSDANSTIVELNSKIDELHVTIADVTVLGSNEEAITDASKVVIDRAWDAVVEELEEEYEVDDMEEEEEVVIEMNDKELGFFNRAIETIVRHKASAMSTVLNADYTEVPDALVESARVAVQSLIAKGKGKCASKEIKAFSNVRDFVEEKKQAISDRFSKEEDSDKEAGALAKLGAFVKSIIVKVLKSLLATGKIVGKAAIVVGTLIAKIVVFTVDETIEAGKAIFTIAKNEYTQAIQG